MNYIATPLVFGLSPLEVENFIMLLTKTWYLIVNSIFVLQVLMCKRLLQVHYSKPFEKLYCNENNFHCVRKCPEFAKTDKENENPLYLSFARPGIFLKTIHHDFQIMAFTGGNTIYFQWKFSNRTMFGTKQHTLSQSKKAHSFSL